MKRTHGKMAQEEQVGIFYEMKSHSNEDNSTQPFQITEIELADADTEISTTPLLPQGSKDPMAELFPEEATYKERAENAQKTGDHEGVLYKVPQEKIAAVIESLELAQHKNKLASGTINNVAILLMRDTDKLRITAQTVRNRGSSTPGLKHQVYGVGRKNLLVIFGDINGVGQYYNKQFNESYLLKDEAILKSLIPNLQKSNQSETNAPQAVAIPTASSEEATPRAPTSASAISTSAPHITAGKQIRGSAVKKSSPSLKVSSVASSESSISSPPQAEQLAHSKETKKSRKQKPRPVTSIATSEQPATFAAPISRESFQLPLEILISTIGQLVMTTETKQPFYFKCVFPLKGYAKLAYHCFQEANLQAEMQPKFAENKPSIIYVKAGKESGLERLADHLGLSAQLNARKREMLTYIEKTLSIASTQPELNLNINTMEEASSLTSYNTASAMAILSLIHFIKGATFKIDTPMQSRFKCVFETKEQRDEVHEALLKSSLGEAATRSKDDHTITIPIPLLTKVAKELGVMSHLAPRQAALLSAVKDKLVIEETRQPEQQYSRGL